jgi:PAS domain S-box-containing protein
VNRPSAKKFNHDVRRRSPRTPRLELDVILDHMSDAVCALDRNWRILYANPRALAEAGRGLEIVGMDLWSVVPEALGTSFERAYRRAMAERIATETEEYYPPFNSWLAARALPWRDGLMVFFRNTTVDRRREAAISEAEARFRVLFRTLSQGVIFHDRDGAITDANPAAEEILGISREELLGKIARDPRWQTTDEHGRRLAEDDYTATLALRSGQPIRGRILNLFHPRRGERRWIRIDAVPQIRPGETRPHQVYTMFDDVTERKQAEDELRDSEARLQSIVGNLPVIVFRRVLGRDGSLTYPYRNAAAESFIGMANAAALADGTQTIWNHIHPDDREKVSQSIAASAAELSRWSCSYRMLDPQGETRWIEAWGTPRRLDNGDTVWDAAAIDVTQQKQVEEALRASEAHLANAQRVAQLGSAQFDFRSGALTWSRETYRIYGLDPETFTPSLERVMELVHPEDRDKFIAVLDDARRGVDPEPVEYRIFRPNGQIRIIYREAAPVRDAAGAVVGFLATKRDLTDIKAAERRQQELQNRLMHTQRLEALGTLAGGIAHDLNNTLVPVVALSEALGRKYPDGHPDRGALQLIREAGERARDLVQRILTFSRRDTPNRRRLDLASFLRDTMRLVRASIPTTIAIEERLEPAPPVLADPAQLHQVIMNLVTNAAQAIGTKLGTITVSLSVAPKQVLDDGDCPCVQLSVVDTGIGMDEATRKRIFEPFFTTKQVGEGTGLGLAMVHGIVASHGGRIEVASERGKGTRIDIFLPAPREAARSLAEEAAE